MIINEFITKVIIYCVLYFVSLWIGNKIRSNRYNREIPIRIYEGKVLAAISCMDGYEFEDFMAFIFKQLGYRVKQTPRSGDGGKDLILKGKDGIIYVECKRYSGENKVSRGLVQKLVGATVSDGYDKCLFVTTSDYTKEAREYAANCKGVNVEIYNLDDILKICKQCNFAMVEEMIDLQLS